jgi:hypothetical protein
MDYTGKTIDLCPHVSTWPELVHPDESAYPACQAIAQEAISVGADGLLTMSARRTGGRNLPVFRQSTLQNARQKALTAFVADSTSGSINVKWRW